MMSMKQINLSIEIYADMMYKWGKIFIKSFSLNREDFNSLAYKLNELIKVNAINSQGEIIETAIFKIIDKVFFPKSEIKNNCYIKLQYVNERIIL